MIYYKLIELLIERGASIIKRIKNEVLQKLSIKIVLLKFNSQTKNSYHGKGSLKLIY